MKRKTTSVAALAGGLMLIPAALAAQSSDQRPAVTRQIVTARPVLITRPVEARSKLRVRLASATDPVAAERPDPSGEARRIQAARAKAARIKAARTKANRIKAARIKSARIKAARIKAARIKAARIKAARSGRGGG